MNKDVAEMIIQEFKNRVKEDYKADKIDDFLRILENSEAAKDEQVVSLLIDCAGEMNK